MFDRRLIVWRRTRMFFKSILETYVPENSAASSLFSSSISRFQKTQMALHCLHQASFRSRTLIFPFIICIKCFSVAENSDSPSLFPSHFSTFLLCSEHNRLLQALYMSCVDFFGQAHFVWLPCYNFVAVFSVIAQNSLPQTMKTLRHHLRRSWFYVTIFFLTSSGFCQHPWWGSFTYNGR